jgi:hypothetical protein
VSSASAVVLVVEDRDIRALHSERDGDGAADAGVGAGNERDLAMSFAAGL